MLLHGEELTEDLDCGVGDFLAVGSQDLETPKGKRPAYIWSISW
jgi:hypothetical protein